MKLKNLIFFNNEKRVSDCNNSIITIKENDVKYNHYEHMVNSMNLIEIEKSMQARIESRIY